MTNYIKNIKNLGFFVYLLLFNLVFINPVKAKPKLLKSNLALPLVNSTLKKIIIDAGHGGTDVGAKGKYSYEKDICLAIALKLEQFLLKNIPNVEIVLTRRTDVFDDVIQKAKIANENKGDLFISIHTNSASGGFLKKFIGMENKPYYVKVKGKKVTRYKKVRKYKYIPLPSNAKGTETFIYNVQKSDQKIDALNEVAEDFSEDLDSSSINKIEELTKSIESDPSQKILARLLTQQFFERSAALALTIEDEFVKIGRESRQAKQRTKGIWVLQAVTMPAVLIETGFISNKDEEDYLNSEEGKNQICEAITKAVIRYKNTIENK